MSEWAAKRFWTETRVVEAEAGWTVHLDGRGVRTPLKAPLIVPTRAMAEAMAAEWDAQEDKIDPISMPVTRSANAALDKVAVQRAEVEALLADYAENDMLCYRAEGPDGLVRRQAEAWDPYLAWGAEALGVALVPTAGIMPVAQPQASLARARGALAAFTDFELTAVHDLVSLSGSLVLGLAVARGHTTAEAAWPISRLDELWQQELWGADAEAESQAALKKAAFLHAERFLSLSVHNS